MHQCLVLSARYMHLPKLILVFILHFTELVSKDANKFEYSTCTTHADDQRPRYKVKHYYYLRQKTFLKITFLINKFSIEETTTFYFPGNVSCILNVPVLVSGTRNTQGVTSVLETFHISA